MVQHERKLAEMTDEEVVWHRRTQAVMQEAINEVAERSEGRPLEDIIDDLVGALAAREIPQQPPRWLEAVAAELQQGRIYVEDPALGREIIRRIDEADEEHRA